MPQRTDVEVIEDLRAALREFLAAQRRLRGRDAQRPGLTFSQHAVLRVLADGEEHSAGELAAAADLTPASITKMLDGLSRAGLLERVPDPADRRRVGVRITPAGREAFDAKNRQITAAWAEVLEGADPAEIDGMASAMRRLAALFDTL
ncbi:MAG TPA: MarR family transcriptional regulator [Capillimicrobium sp.]|nr:MarR family transcriptional regulator [Capillimicrobium sp.]